MAISENGGPVMCFRALSVEKLRAQVRSGRKVVELGQILAEKQLTHAIKAPIQTGFTTTGHIARHAHGTAHTVR